MVFRLQSGEDESVLVADLGGWFRPSVRLGAQVASGASYLGVIEVPDETMPPTLGWNLSRWRRRRSGDARALLAAVWQNDGSAVACVPSADMEMLAQHPDDIVALQAALRLAVLPRADGSSWLWALTKRSSLRTKKQAIAALGEIGRPPDLAWLLRWRRQLGVVVPLRRPVDAAIARLAARFPEDLDQAINTAIEHEQSELTVRLVARRPSMLSGSVRLWGVASLVSFVGLGGVGLLIGLSVDAVILMLVLITGLVGVLVVAAGGALDVASQASDLRQRRRWLNTRQKDRRVGSISLLEPGDRKGAVSYETAEDAGAKKVLAAPAPAQRAVPNAADQASDKAADRDDVPKSTGS